MISVLSKMVLVLIFTLAGALSLSQEAPSQINAALLDLSARLEYSVGIGNLSNWRWEQTNFANSALGCPTVSGSGGAVLGYRFQLTHNAIAYDYRVSADNTLVVYCGVVDAASAAAAPESESQYSNRLCSDTATGGPYMRSRINVGMDVEVLGGYLNLRGQPSINGQVLLQIPAGLPVGVTAGPDCVDGYVWWLAIVNGQTGYIAESGDGSYLVAPAAPPPMPSREILNVSIVPYLMEFGRIYGNFQPSHVWSSENHFLAMPGALGSDGVWIYDLRHPTLAPEILAFDGGISALEFRPFSEQFVFASESGTLHLWQIIDGTPLTFSDRLFLNAHAGAVSAIAFSADGERLVSAGRKAFTHVDVYRDWAGIVWDLPTVAQQAILSGHSGLINSMAFGADKDLVFTGADDGTMRNWDASNGFNTFTVNFDSAAPVRALAYSEAGSLVAVALARPSDNLLIYGSEGATRLASYPLPTNNVTSIDFSPDGSMLVVGAVEGIVSIWDTRTRQLLATRETDGGVYDVSFSPDGTLIAASTENHTLVLYGVPLGSG